MDATFGADRRSDPGARSDFSPVSRSESGPVSRSESGPVSRSGDRLSDSRGFAPPAADYVSASPSGDRDGTPTVNRDRDTGGRPRNARPRDALGRPLPRDAPGIPTTPDDLSLAPEQALDEAQRLLDAGRPFHAHEVLEGVWKAAPEPERELWRGLAQLAVGLTHAHRGNRTGASRLLLRAADRIEPYASDHPYGVPVAALAGWARDLSRRISEDPQGGSVATPPPPRLRG